MHFVDFYPGNNYQENQETLVFVQIYVSYKKNAYKIKNTDV